MGKKTTVQAPAADPNIGIAAEKQAQLGIDWLNESKRQFEIANDRQVGIDEVTKLVTQQQLASSQQAQHWATEDRARYTGTFQPLQDDFIQRATNWDSADRQASVAAEARADVLSAAAAGREAAQRQAAAMGISPTSGRYAGIERQGEAATALAAAGAQNVARNQVRKEGMALRGEAINLGAGLGVNPAASLGLGVQAGGAALQGGLAAAGNARANVAGLQNGYATAMSGFQNQASILGQQDQRALSAWTAQTQANSQRSSSIMGGLGSLAGIGAALYMNSSKDVKEDKRPTSGALDAVMSMPVEEWRYKQGKGDGERHIGPYAEDFQRQTGMGDGKSINVIDAIGINMRATQELAEEVRAMRRDRPKARGISPERRAA